MAADPSIFSGFSASLGTLFSQQPQPLSMPDGGSPWPSLGLPCFFFQVALGETGRWWGGFDG
jgi:hypothetical protein